MDNDSRIARNLELADSLHWETGSRRDALRRVMSFFAHVERIAILAAERGDGIPGQLDDEIVHQRTFQALADSLGGCEPISEPTQLLLDYLAGSRGQASLALLNVVCEAWLEGIFHHVGPLAPAMFETMEAEEARHAEVAREMFSWDGSPDEMFQGLREVEALLADVAADPEFLVPLQFLLGPPAVARLGRANVRSHARACDALGAPPGPRIRDVEKSARAVLTSHRPLYPLGWPDTTQWEASKAQIWSEPAPMQVWLESDLSDDPGHVEAHVVYSLDQILQADPRLNRTFRAGRIYAPEDRTIAVRRPHDPISGDLTSIYAVNCSRGRSRGALQELLRSKTRRVRARAYDLIRPHRHLEHLLPAPRAAVTVSQVAHYGVEQGWAPFGPCEGATISVCIGSRGLGILMDHRAHDGREIGALCKALRRFV